MEMFNCKEAIMPVEMEQQVAPLGIMESVMEMFNCKEAIMPVTEAVQQEAPINNTAMEAEVDQVKAVQPYNRMTANPGTLKSATNVMNKEDEESNKILTAWIKNDYIVLSGKWSIKDVCIVLHEKWRIKYVMVPRRGLEMLFLLVMVVPPGVPGVGYVTDVQALAEMVVPPVHDVVREEGDGVLGEEDDRGIPPVHDVVREDGYGVLGEEDDRGVPLVGYDHVNDVLPGLDPTEDNHADVGALGVRDGVFHVNVLVPVVGDVGLIEGGARGDDVRAEGEEPLDGSGEDDVDENNSGWKDEINSGWTRYGFKMIYDL